MSRTKTRPESARGSANRTTRIRRHGHGQQPRENGHGPDPAPQKPGRIGLLFLSIAIVLVLFYKLSALSSIPCGLAFDEAGYIYNAYSVAMTGADEYGVKWPLYFKSFNDWKNPVFIYAVAPLTYLFGPTALAGRLVAALFSIAAAVGVGLLASALTRDRRIAVAMGLAASVTPWLFAFGRIAFSASAYPAFYAFALWATFRAVEKKRGKWFAAAGLLWAVTILTYTAARVVVPLTLLVLAVTHGREFLRCGRQSLAGAIAFAVGNIPLLLFWLDHPGALSARGGNIMVWSNNAGYFGAAWQATMNYLEILSPRFLFYTGDPSLRHNPLGGGELLVVLLPLILCGLWALIRKARTEPGARFLLVSLLLFPAPAAITLDPPHATRTLAGAVLLLATAGVGAAALAPLVSRQRGWVALWCGFLLLEVGLGARFYFNQHPLRAVAHYNAALPEACAMALEKRGSAPLYFPEDLCMDENGFSRDATHVFLTKGRLDPGRYQHGGLETFGIHKVAQNTPIPRGAYYLEKDNLILKTEAGVLVKVQKPTPLPEGAVEVAHTDIPTHKGGSHAAYRLYRIE